MPSNPGKHPLSTPPQSTQCAERPICSELPIIATSTVAHRDGSCLNISRNRPRDIVYRIHGRCYQKTLKKRFLISFSTWWGRIFGKTDTVNITQFSHTPDRLHHICPIDHILTSLIGYLSGGIALPPGRQQKQKSFAKMREESDLSLEVVILLIFGVFMSFFGLLLFRIHTGELPYTPDSMYGLFLVLVSIQTITMGKTPFGDLRRSWMVIIIGIGTAVIGMTACFIPGPLTGAVRILVGLMLAVGGASLLFQLFVAEERAKTWMKVPGILRHLTLAASLVYVLSVIAGLVTLLPGITTNPQTAVLLVIYGISFFYLAWSIQEVGRRYPPEIPKKSAPGTLDPAHACPKSGFSFFRDASLPLSLQYSASWPSSSPSLGSCSSR